MKNHVIFGIVLMMLTVQFGNCASIHFTFDHIVLRWFNGSRQESKTLTPSRELEIEANFTYNKSIIISLHEVEQVGKFALFLKPILSDKPLQDASKSVWSDYKGKIAGRAQYEFYFGMTLNTTADDTPCVRIEHTDSSLCHLYIVSTLSFVGYKAGELPLFVRVDNITGKPSLKLFGSMYQSVGNASVVQSLAQKTEELIKFKMIPIFRDAPPYVRERIMVFEQSNPAFLNESRPQFIFFACQDGTKRLIEYTSDDIRHGSAIVNLSDANLPFNRHQNCSFTAVFRDVHAGNNLLPLIPINTFYTKSDQFQIGPKPNSTNHETLLERYHKLQKMLKATEEELETIETAFNNGETVRFLISKTFKRV